MSNVIPENYDSVSPNVVTEDSSSFNRVDFPLRILVRNDMVGAFMGIGGATIRQISKQTKARVDVHHKGNAEAFDKDKLSSFQAVTIHGYPQNCSAACKIILRILQEKSNELNMGQVPLKILAHNKLIGRVIGRKGAILHEIMEKSNTRIRISSINEIVGSTLDRIITIQGTLDNMCRAEEIISSKLQRGYEEDLKQMNITDHMNPYTYSLIIPAYDTSNIQTFHNVQRLPYGFYNSPYLYPSNNMSMVEYPNLYTKKETVCIYVPSATIGAVIGAKGCSIKQIIIASGAHIKIDQMDEETSTQQAERKITINGNFDSQRKAQLMIFQKVNNKSGIPPQDFCLRVEIFVNPKQIGHIIGKGGLMIKQIQNLSRAIVRIPESKDISELEKVPVHIIGDFDSTQVAQYYIREVLHRNNSEFIGSYSAFPASGP